MNIEPLMHTAAVIKGELGVNRSDIPQELIVKISTFNIKVRELPLLLESID
jgi:hypothetical protein